MGIETGSNHPAMKMNIDKGRVDAKVAGIMGNPGEHRSEDEITKQAELEVRRLYMHGAANEYRQQREFQTFTRELKEMDNSRLVEALQKKIEDLVKSELKRASSQWPGWREECVEHEEMLKAVTATISDRLNSGK